MKDRACDLTYVYRYLRGATVVWSDATRSKYSNRCVITGVTHSIDVHHHIKSYQSIVRQAFEDLGIPHHMKTSHFTHAQLQLLWDKVAQLHDEIGPGICITKRIHKKLHEVTEDGTGEAYKDFVQNYNRRVRRSKGQPA